MPLSDEERRRLEQLDREFSADDPQLARKLRQGLIQPLPAAGPILHGLGVVTALGVILMGLIGVIDGGFLVGVFFISMGCYWLSHLQHAPRHGQSG